MPHYLVLAIVAFAAVNVSVVLGMVLGHRNKETPDNLISYPDTGRLVRVGEYLFVIDQISTYNEVELNRIRLSIELSADKREVTRYIRPRPVPTPKAWSYDAMGK